jgi:superkiller protein 3
MESIVLQARSEDPILTQWMSRCAAARWFDGCVAIGFYPDEAGPAPSLAEAEHSLQAWPFCERHPDRPDTWRFAGEFRAFLAARPEIKRDWQALQSRALNIFRAILDGKGLSGEARFRDDDWRLVATEWLYHLLQIDCAAGLGALTGMCAESLAIPVYRGPSWEIDFCVRLLADIEWPPEDESLNRAVEDLRKGFDDLAAGRNMRALPMVKRLAEVPGLTPQQEGELHYFMGITHLYDEGKKGPALEELGKAARLVPALAKVHAEIAAVHSMPGTLWGRLDLAEESAREAIRVQSTEAEGHVALGRIWAQQEEWEQAIASYEKAIAVDSDDTDGTLALSDAYSARREVAKAIQLIDRAWQIGGWSEHSAAIRRGDVLSGARDFDRARNEYQRAVTLAPDQPATHLALGSWHESTLALTEAAELYRKAIELDPALEDGYVALARLYGSQNKLRKAIDTCQNCLAKAVAGKAVYIALGNFHEQMENFPELESAQAEISALDWGEIYGCHCAAASAWLSMARKRPGSPELSTWLARAQARIDQAIELDEKRAWAYMLLAELHVVRGEYDRLDEIERMVAARAPWARYDWLVAVAQTCLQCYDGQRCESLLTRAIDLAPHRTPAWQVLVNLCAWRGDPAGAARAWTKMAQLDPASQYDAHISIGDAHLRIQDHARARQEYSKAIDTEPYTAQGYLSLAAVAEAEGKQDEAVEHYRTAAEKASGPAPAALTSIARLQREQRRFQTAEESLRRAIDLDPEQSETYMELARLGVMHGRQDLVTEASERVASLSPHRRYELYSALGDAYRSFGGTSDACAAFNQCQELDPGRADAYIGLAGVFADQELWDDARATLEKAIKVDRTALGAYIILSRVCDARSDIEGVISAQRRIVEMEPTERYNACIHIGAAYEKISQVELAEQHYREALTLYPWQSDAYICLGFLLAAHGTSEAVEELFEKARLEANIGYLELGQNLENTGRLEDAHKIYTIGMKHVSTDAQIDLCMASARLYRQLKKPGKAESDLRRAISLNPGRPEGYVELMVLFAGEGRLDDAVQVCHQMARQPGLAYGAHVSLGSLLAEKEDYGNAEEAFRQAIQLSPGASDAYDRLGQLLVGQERPRDAAKVYREMAGQPELAWQAHVLLGDLWVEQEKPGQAEQAYRKAVKLDPRQPAGYLRLARLHQGQGKLDKAEALIEKARKAAPDSADPYVVLAQLREQQGRTDDAIALYRQLVQLRPNEASGAFQRIGDLLIALERHDEAAAALGLAVQRDPSNAGAYFSLGTIHERQGNLEQAAEMYSRTIHANSDYHKAYIALGRVYGQQGNKSALESIVRQLMSLDLEPEERYAACLESAELYKTVDEAGSARASYDRAIELDPLRPEGYVALMRLFAGEGRLDDAVQVCHQMARQPELAYGAHVSRGSLLAEKQDHGSAEEAFRQAIRLSPGASDAYERLGQLLVGQERPRDAAKVYREMAGHPELAWQAHVLLGDLWVEQEKPKQAEQAYRKAVKIDPRQPVGYLRLAQVYQRRHGKLDEAEALIEGAMQASPDSIDPYIALEQLREQQGRIDDAVALCHEIARRKPDEASTAHERIGDLLIALERYDEAAAALRQAVRQDPANAGAYFSLGTIHERQASLEQAAEMYSRAIEANPRDLNAYGALCRVHGQQGSVARIANLAEQLPGLSLAPSEQYEAHMAIGAAYQEAQAPEWATDAFNAARDLDPARTEAYLALGQVYEMQRRWADARGVYSKLHELVPAWQPDVHRKLGELYALEGLFSEAEQEYRKVVSLAPERPDGYHGLVQVHMRQQQWLQASEMCERLTRLEEVDPVVKCSGYLYLADLRRTLGNAEGMLEACSQVISLVNTIESPSSDLLRQKGLALFMRGQVDQASEPLQRCLEAEPGDAKAHFYLALNLLCMGERVQAERRFTEGLAHIKDGSELYSAIREAEALAASTPAIPGAREMLEALQKAADNAGRQP